MNRFDTLSQTDAAELLGINQSSIGYLVETGALPTVRVEGYKYARIPRAALENGFLTRRGKRHIAALMQATIEHALHDLHTQPDGISPDVIARAVCAALSDPAVLTQLSSTIQRLSAEQAQWVLCNG